MAKQLLHRPNVVAALEQMRGKAVAQSVRPDRFADARSARGRADGLLDHRFVQMMPPPDARPRVHRYFRGGEHPLPSPLDGGLRVLAVERVRQGDPAEPRWQATALQSGGCLRRDGYRRVAGCADAGGYCRA